MKVLVTGAKGFVGTAIVEKLSADNHETYVLLNSKTSGKKIIENSGVVQVVYADIADYESVGKLDGIGKIDAVIHCAGLAHQFGNTVEADFWRINVEGTANIAKLAVLLQVQHFILISSVAVYGKASEEKSDVEINAVAEESICQPSDFYSRSKLESEKAAQAICADNNINLTILRPSTVIGENDRGNVARLIKTIDENRFFWIGSGENLKSLIYKDDVAKACLCILNRKQPKQDGINEIFNVTAEALPMSEIVFEIHERLGKKNPRFHVSPAFVKLLFLLNRKTFNIRRIEKLFGTVGKWLSDDVFSGDKIKQRYGFEAETPVREAIRREVESYKKA
jgi:nucleoside-diphosphate-sugar epimerase